MPRSGGTEAHRTAHGSQASQTWKLSGGLRAIVEDLTDNVILPSGGANSGVSRAMLLAGENSQADVTKSEVSNSIDPDHWMKLGDKRFAEVNDGDLAWWFINHEIPIVFRRRFWPKDGIDMKGICVDLIRNTHKPHEVDIIIEQPGKRNPLKVTWYRTEVFISRDPTVDGSKDIHRNCLRDAIVDTYPNASDQTLQQLKEESKRFNAPLGQVPPALLAQPDADSQAGPAPRDASNTPPDSGASSSSNPQPTPAPQSKPTQAAENTSSKGKRKQTPSSHDQPAQAQKRANVRGLSNTHIASAAIHAVARKAAGLVAFAYEAVTGITTASTKRAEAERLARDFQLRCSSKGGPVCALYATMTVCAMAESLGYTAAFLPPEPRNQREAQRRPDCDKWHAAEQKELGTLWKMGTFELVAKPPNHDPLPLQFVYKLKVKDGDFDNCIYKARLVMRGNLQYEHEYGDTYAPTARLWVVRTMAAIAAQ